MNAPANTFASVIVPTFNRPRMLLHALKSVLAQTLQDFEIVIVNDGGSDVSPVIAELNDPRLRLINHPANRGLAAARNTGIRSAAGEYIALLDDDDFFYPQHLETARQVLSENVAVIYTDAVRAVLVRQGDRYVVIDRQVPYSLEFDRHKLLIGNIAPVNCFVFKRELGLKAGLFDETLSTLEDWDFWIRLSAITPFKHVQAQTVQVNFRTDGTTMSSSRQQETVENRKRILNRHMHEIERIPNIEQIVAEFNRIWELEARAMGALE